MGDALGKRIVVQGETLHRPGGGDGDAGIADLVRADEGRRRQGKFIAVIAIEEAAFAVGSTWNALPCSITGASSSCARSRMVLRASSGWALRIRGTPGLMMPAFSRAIPAISDPNQSA